MIKYQYAYVWKCHNETHYYVGSLFILILIIYHYFLFIYYYLLLILIKIKF